jgi:hypothetical protein
VRIFFYFLCIIYNTKSDKGFYIDSDAVFDGHSYLDTSLKSHIKLFIKTSNNQTAGTVDDVWATFIGTFSSSGPINIGNFESGTDISINIELTNVIGNLKSIWFEKKGFDNWLISNISYELNGVTSKLSFSKQWINNISTRNNLLNIDDAIKTLSTMEAFTVN